jgi:hypothetical protein
VPLNPTPLETSTAQLMIILCTIAASHRQVHHHRAQHARYDGAYAFVVWEQAGDATTLRAIAPVLNERNIPTATGRGEW